MDFAKDPGKSWRYIGVINGQIYQRNHQIYGKSAMIRSVANALYSFVISEKLPKFQSGCIPEEHCRFSEKQMDVELRAAFHKHWQKLQLPIIRDIIIGGFVVYIIRKIDHNGTIVPIIITEHLGTLFNVHI